MTVVRRTILHLLCVLAPLIGVAATSAAPIDPVAQLQSDMRWIREPFLFDDSDHGFVVVHGHTISEEVEEHSNRIGIDTGAYRSGILSALAIENGDRWLVDTREMAETDRSATD